jgi:hypothetical protein
MVHLGGRGLIGSRSPMIRNINKETKQVFFVFFLIGIILH